MGDRLISHVALPAEKRDALAGSLNVALATTYDLYSQVKHAHWNLKGPQFIGLHRLFDELAGRLLGHGDRLAERASALGAVVAGTARQWVSASQLKEYELGASDGKTHLSALVMQYAAFGARLRDAIEAAEREGDPVTADLLVQVLGPVEQDLWLLESHINV
jgi:starvation-inducible DNA-binding protein